MIYLDNAATTYPKPQEVLDEVMECICRYGANPGRGGHKLSMKAGRKVYEVREMIADFFHIEDPLRVIFTSNTTQGLNMALHGVLKAGDHMITTAMDHNSLLRPSSSLKEKGVEVTIVPCGPDGSLNLTELEAAIRPNTRLIACCHASNLIGQINPIEQIGEMCRRHALLFLVDAAQSAGILPIDVQKAKIDLLAAPGHKSLFGIMGSGFLYVGPRAEVLEMYQGGTGSRSEDIFQPRIWPDRYESGTLNLPGIVSLGAGIRFIRNEGLQAIEEKEKELGGLLMEGLLNVPGITVYGSHTMKNRTAVIAVNLADATSSELACALDEEYDICTRGGLHCAPLAHETLGSKKKGAVRFSVGYFNTKEEIQRTIDAVAAIEKEYREE